MRGVPDRAIPLGTLVEALSQPNLGGGRAWPASRPLPWDDTLGLEASAVYRPDFTFSYAVHAAVVEVDTETGAVQIVRYVVVHDCGKVLNPAAVDGQVTGGVAQGLGGALLEEMIYDGAGQNVSSTLMSYALPRASEVPPFTLDHLETPAANPLGVKGAGEGGVLPVAAVISAAVDDALAPWKTFCDRTPLTSERVWGMIHAIVT